MHWFPSAVLLICVCTVSPGSSNFHPENVKIEEMVASQETPEVTDRLVEIPRSEWSNLRDMFKVDWPRNHVGFYTVDNYVRWIQKDPEIKNLKIFSLNGDWSDGTFLVVDRYQLFLNSLNESNDRLTRALELLDWSRGLKVSSFLHRHRPAVLAVVDSRQYQKEYDSFTKLYYLPREKARLLELNPPEDIILRPMTENDAETANEVWPNRHQGSLFFLKRLINWNPQIGAYTKDGELVAWCFRLQAGPLGALQVKDTHMRRGLGTLVTIAMAKILADMDQDTFALVGMQNIPSQRMFEKLGFEDYDKCYWLRTLPFSDFQWEDD